MKPIAKRNRRHGALSYRSWDILFGARTVTYFDEVANKTMDQIHSADMEFGNSETFLAVWAAVTVKLNK